VPLGRRPITKQREGGRNKSRRQNMEDGHNEYGNGVDDLVRRSDAEFWMERRDERAAERNIMQRELMEVVGSGSEDGEYEDWDGEVDLENPLSGRKFVKYNREGRKTNKIGSKRIPTKRKVKLETTSELREKIGEKNRLKEIRKAIGAGRKMRKEGKMKDISNYFKK
jgi:hypothetical protein